MIARGVAFAFVLAAAAAQSGAFAQTIQSENAPSDAAPALTSAVPVAPPTRARRNRAQTRAFALPRDLTGALSVDAQGKTLVAQRRAAGARYATVESLTPGSPYIAGQARGLGQGSYRNLAAIEPNANRVREAELEMGMPLWLPGQRDALRATVDTTLVEYEQRLALRRLELAGLVRDAWWSAQRAAREVEIARERVTTSKDLQYDMDRRAELGDAPPYDALVARNETLAAETERSITEAAAKAARATYATLTAGGAPDGVLEPLKIDPPLDAHPALGAPLASVARAQAQVALVEATPIDNPELGVFGRRESTAQGNARADSTTFGLRFRMTLPTAGRNDPRRAEAQAGLTKAYAELASARRLVAAEITAARRALEAARRTEAIASERLKVAGDTFEIARKAFRLGETGVSDLYRAKQALLEAQKMRANASIDLGVAQSRLNQARGYAPTA